MLTKTQDKIKTIAELKTKAKPPNFLTLNRHSTTNLGVCKTVSPRDKPRLGCTPIIKTNEYY